MGKPIRWAMGFVGMFGLIFTAELMGMQPDPRDLLLGGVGAGWFLAWTGMDWR